MTRNQIELAKHLEDVRTHQAQENEQHRANLASESLKQEANAINRDVAAETARANLARETETNRINSINSTETHRSNLAKEELERSKQDETHRSNVINEYENYRHHVNQEQIDDYEAVTDRYKLSFSLGKTGNLTTSILAGMAGEHAYEPAEHFKTDQNGVLVTPTNVNVINKDVRPGILDMDALDNKYTAQKQTKPIKKGDTKHGTQTILSEGTERSGSSHRIQQPKQTKSRAQQLKENGSDVKSLLRRKKSDK